MAKHKTAVPFQGTAEQEQKLKEIIAAHKDMQGALMPVLQQAQEVYGYLPIGVHQCIQFFDIHTHGTVCNRFACRF